MSLLFRDTALQILMIKHHLMINRKDSAFRFGLNNRYKRNDKEQKNLSHYFAGAKINRGIGELLRFCLDIRIFGSSFGRSVPSHGSVYFSLEVPHHFYNYII